MAKAPFKGTFTQNCNGAKMDISDINAEAIRALAKLLEETSLNEIEYQTDTLKIRVAKAASSVTVERPVLSAPLDFSEKTTPSLESPSSQISEKGTSDTIKSPMVGTIYLASKPGAAPMIRAGDAVREGQPLLIVEAMKVMNTIRAPRDGTIKRICVVDGQPVEFGEPLVVLV